MPVLKNIRQERFVRLYVASGNAAEAYRQAYPTCNPTETAKRNAWILLNRVPKVQRRAKELVKAMIKKADITVDRILGDYEEAKDMARAQQKPADLMNAATAQAKLVGLLRDRVETGGVGDFESMDNISEILEKVAATEGPEAALALAKAFGLELAQAEQETPLAQAQPASKAVN